MSLRTGAVTVVLILFLALSLAGQAQTASGSLHGQVTDPSGAVISKATITLKGAKGETSTAVSNAKGTYEIKGLPPGKYSLRATAKGFSPETKDVIVTTVAQSLDISLKIEVEQQSVTVEDSAATVSTESSQNANSIVLKGKDLDALSDNPEDLQADLEALAGPSAGPNGGQIYIDGFSNGTLPPKSSIREIRVNQNPFSAQYDRLGFGRVEVFTKPGTDAYHGMFQVNVNHSMFNSLNPYVHQQRSEVPDYHTTQYSGNISGPVNRKSSFFLNLERRSVDEVTIFNAKVPCGPNTSVSCDQGANYSTYSGTQPNPRIRTEISPRIDYQLTPNNTLSVRYEYESSSNKNGGVSNFNLPTQAFNSNDNEHDVRISDTQIVNASTINEMRLQFNREHSEQVSLSPGQTLQVADMFVGGGYSSGNSVNDQQHVEFQNYTSKVSGKHFIRFGARVRRNSEIDKSRDNWLGTVEFRDLKSYYDGIWERYSVSWGNPRSQVSQTDAGLYAEDDWKLRRNMTLSYGLRFETQSNVTSKANFAPRVGFAWGLGRGSSPSTVLRVGAGMFYDRFSAGNVMQVNRTNSLNPLYTMVADNPTLSTALPDPSSMTPQTSVVYQITPDFKIPYTTQVAATLERQLGRGSNVSVSYINTRGLHQLYRRNAGSLLGESGPYVYETGGTFKQNQLMVNSRVSLSKVLSLFGWYTYSRANGNTNGGFPTDSSDLNADWGRSSFDVRHRGMIGGSINLPMGVRLNPMIHMSSGRPYSVIAGSDLNKDRILNDRPWFSGACANADYATNQSCYSVIATSYGRVPVNSLTGPGMFNANLRLSKTFGFGRKLDRGAADAAAVPGGPAGGPMMGQRGGGFGGRGGHGHFGGMMGGNSGQKYSVTFSASARNLLNTFNKSTPSGTLTSQNFGLSTSSGGGFGHMGGSANRRIDFGMTLNF